MSYEPLKYIYEQRGGPEAFTLLLLHGTGGNERDLLSLAGDFGAGVNVLSVRGNVLENGMPRFFKRISMGVFDEEDLAFRVDELADFLAKLAGELKFDGNKVVALGYSNGANIAGGLLALYPDLLAGAILYRPMQPFREAVRQKQNTKHTPVFITNGVSDPTVDSAESDRYAGLLTGAGFDVKVYHLQAGHNLIRQDLQLSVAWFEEHFRGLRHETDRS